MKSLVAFFIVVAAAAAVGGRFRPGAWYALLEKPSWTPPNWIFAPVWTLLYIAIAVAGWLVWRSNPRLSAALVLWIAQIALNTAWSWLFFGFQRPALAFADIVLLWIAIAGFAFAARRVRIAAILFIPYALWVAYAAALNFAIWQANAGAAV